MKPAALLLKFASLALCALVSFLPMTAQAQRPMNQPEIESLVAPVALYPDNVVAEVLAAAADPARLDSLSHEELRDQMMQSPQWTSELGYAFAMQPAEVWGAVGALRQRAGAYGQPMAPVYWRPWVPRRVIVVSNSYGAARAPNGPPSIAAQMQQGNLPSPAARMQQGNLPSPAARMQQERPPIHQEPIVQPRHEHREHRSDRRHRQ